MIWAWVGLGFVAACVVTWLLVFPEARGRLAARIAKAFADMSGRAARSGSRLARGAGSPARRLRSGGEGLLAALRRHRVVLAIALLLVCVPPLVILGVRQKVVLERFEGQDLSVSRSTIAVLLRGERLVPPPPPPPDVFTSAEVRRVMPAIVTADRRWERIDPDLQQRVLAIYQVMAQEHGIRMVLVEGYRSPERQAELFREGRATQAAAGQSCHQYGLALDSAPMREGKLQWDMQDEWTRNAYFLYGELAQAAGLVWGGNWRMGDFVHVEMGAQCRAAKRARAQGE